MLPLSRSDLEPERRRLTMKNKNSREYPKFYLDALVKQSFEALKENDMSYLKLLLTIHAADHEQENKLNLLRELEKEGALHCFEWRALIKNLSD